ncbi:MAG: glycosyltransferase [Gemmatimonadota bacterium]|nr:glycosyltransferase [Gemmatimonadota bacterium]
MSYLYVDVELDHPLPTVTLSDEEVGLGVVVRLREVLVGFLLTELPRGSTVSAQELDALIGASCASRLVQETVLESMGGRGELSQISLTAAVCTHDRTAGLEQLMASLLPLREESAFEVLVVDNAPSDESTKTFVATLPGVRYVREDQTGLDFARNRAIAEATGDVLAFLDDDVEVDRGWLQGLRLAWGEHPDAGCVTGLVLPFELATQAQITFELYGGFRRGFDTLRYVGQSLPGNRLYPLGAGIFGAGCNMSYRRDLLRRLGGFDEALDTGRPLPGGGDLDMFHRVVRSGYPLVYEPRYAVFHKHRREHSQLRRQLWTWGTGFMAYVVKTFRADPVANIKLVWLVAWWFRIHVKEVVRSVLGRGPLSPELAVAQLAGGVVGLSGTYGRSRRRSAAIRAQVASQARG